MYASDWHIHSEHSCDEACLPIGKLARQAPAAGVTDFGVTDHFHTPYNLPDIAASRREFEKYRLEGFHFGVEVSVVSKWELGLIAGGTLKPGPYGIRRGGDPATGVEIGISEVELASFGVEFVVGGAHWPMYTELERWAIIRDYHRQNMFLACDPRVDIVAHPWWWMGGWIGADGTYTAEPWLDDFGVIPRSMHDEFAAAVRQNGKCVEANIGAMLTASNYTEKFRVQYAEYLRSLFESGVAITLGSDCHDAEYANFAEAARAILTRVGFRGDDFSIPKFRTY